MELGVFNLRKWLGIPKEKLYVTVFEGDEDAPRDMESYEHWRGLGVAEDHIFFLPKSITGGGQQA